MSEIDYSQLRSLTASVLCNALTRDGFVLTRQQGSHHRYAHDDGRRVTVPFTRKGNTFAVGLSEASLKGKHTGHQKTWSVLD